MLDDSDIAIVVGVVVPLAVIFGICIAVVIYRIRNRSIQEYSQVSHCLDEEEMEFKRMIEMGATNSSSNNTEKEEDDIDDILFDTTDMNRLQMLDRYRNSLVASVGSSIVSNSSSNNDVSSTDSELSENLQL
jgi:hypothetical protein